MAPRQHSGGGGGGACARIGPRLALIVVFLVYCVMMFQHSRAQGAQRTIGATSPLELRMRVAHAHAGLAGARAGASSSASVPLASAAPAAAAGIGAPLGRQSFCTGPFLASNATPIVTDDSMLSDEPPVAAGDVASVHVPALTRSFCQRWALNKALITTAADQRYMTWARNWAKSLQAHGVTNLFIGAMDAQALRHSHAEGIPAVLLGRMRAGTTWHSANRYKIRLVQAVVELGFDVLFTDADVTFIRDPMPFLLKYPEAGVLISTDLLVRETPYPMVNGLENPYETVGKFRADLNVGLMFVRATLHTTQMMNHWADVANADMSKSMQTFFVKLVREYAACLPPTAAHPELAPCYNGTVNVGLLPMDLFCGGYIYFVDRLPQRTGLQAISTHATYQVHQGLDGKRERLRHAHLWYLDDAEYYNPPGGLLTMAPFQLPPWVGDARAVARYGEGGDLRDAHLNRTLVHFELVHAQLRQLRSALALAAMLGRTLVMPDFTVLIDNTWYPMNGAWPGFRKLGPFVAPLDHVLHMTQLQNNRVDFRSSTFLEHPCIRRTYASATRAAVAFEVGARPPTAAEARGAARIVLPMGASQVRAARSSRRAHRGGRRGIAWTATTARSTRARAFAAFRAWPLPSRTRPPRTRRILPLQHGRARTRAACASLLTAPAHACTRARARRLKWRLRSKGTRRSSSTSSRPSISSAGQSAARSRTRVLLPARSVAPRALARGARHGSTPSQPRLRAPHPHRPRSTARARPHAASYDDPSEQSSFAARINRTPMLWCCVTKNVANELFHQPFPPGHIYYDFYADQPHTDRFGRRYGAKWDLRVGP
jgi:hypothetical protein